MIPFDLTYLIAFQANSRAVASVSVRIAIEQAKDRLDGAVLASDAFFPFADNVEEIAKAGIKAIIQPGGSVRDQESIEAADKHGLTMIFTGVRHFRH